MLWRIENSTGQPQGDVTAPHGDNAAVRDGLANLVGGSLAGCIRRASVLPEGLSRLTITPLRADGSPLLRHGRAVFYTAILVHDGEDN